MKCRSDRYSSRAVSWAGILLAAGLLATSGARAQDLDFKDQDLANKSFNGKMLDGADFSGATLRSANFTGASLKGANFDNADLRTAFISNADMTGANLKTAVIGFIGDFVNFTRADFEGADLKGYYCHKCNFRGANLRKTTGWSKMGNANFRGADLRGANLSTLKDTEVEMGRSHDEAMFAGAIYDDATRWPSWIDVRTARAKRSD